MEMQRAVTITFLVTAVMNVSRGFPVPVEVAFTVEILMFKMALILSEISIYHVLEYDVLSKNDLTLIKG